MSSQLYPIVGNWYKDETEQVFEVVAMDEEEGYVEIQYFGGEIDEIDFESWESLRVENVAPPEDWSGAYDDMEPDDFGFSDMGSGGSNIASSFSVEDLD